MGMEFCGGRDGKERKGTTTFVDVFFSKSRTNNACEWRRINFQKSTRNKKCPQLLLWSIKSKWHSTLEQELLPNHKSHPISGIGFLVYEIVHLTWSYDRMQSWNCSIAVGFEMSELDIVSLRRSSMHFIAQVFLTFWIWITCIPRNCMSFDVCWISQNVRFKQNNQLFHKSYELMTVLVNRLELNFLIATIGRIFRAKCRKILQMTCCFFNNQFMLPEIKKSLR